MARVALAVARAAGERLGDLLCTGENAGNTALHPAPAAQRPEICCARGRGVVVCAGVLEE